MSPRHARWLALGAFAALAWVTLRCAWMSDDAFITLRHIEHLMLGHGLRFNVAERVASYTHPLWMLLLLPGHALTRDPFYAPLALSGLVSAGAAAVVVRTSSTWAGAAAALLVLASSKAYVDFSTSGLENPLTHLLLALFVHGLSRDAPAPRQSLLGAALLLTRLDTLLLVAPALAWRGWQHPSRGWLWGLLPLTGWHLGALVYYGVPLPNTAYAKLGHGLPRDELVGAGLRWLEWALWTDPATLLALCLAVPIWLAGDGRTRSVGLGAALYVAYVVWIGGDFMGDRFLSAPTLLAAFAIASHPLRFAAAGLVVALSVLTPHSPWRAGPGYTKAPPRHGVVDERGYYWPGMGLWSTASGPRPAHPFARTGERLQRQEVRRAVKATAGMVGYYGGPQLHLVDPLGLTDPFLARLPARYDPDWRVGHYRRVVPRGYGAAADTDAITLDDPELQALYDTLALVHRGPLWSKERWQAIVALQLGRIGERAP